MWLLGRLVPDRKTIADFHKDNGPAIRKVCARFVELCRQMGLLTKASVAIDGSKFKTVNNRAWNFTRAKVEGRRAQLEERIRTVWRGFTGCRSSASNAVAEVTARERLLLTRPSVQTTQCVAPGASGRRFRCLTRISLPGVD